MDKAVFQHCDNPGENWLQRLFSRPWLAAIVVGSAIHGFSTLNLWLTAPDNYLAHHWGLLLSHPGFGVTQLLIPFFVPWVVASIANYLNCLSREQLLNAFPESNPDLIIKLDEQGDPIYANRQVREWLRKMGEPEAHIDALLPPAYRKLAASLEGRGARICVRHQVAGSRFDFLIQRDQSDGLFIAGRHVGECSHSS